MGFVELLLTTVVTCLVGITMTTAQGMGSILTQMSKPGCESQCGNVTVPFPFGMGKPDCFLDEWFETVCNKSVTPPKLFLKRTNLEVINMSLYYDDINSYSSYRFTQQIEVKSWISFSKCGPKEPRQIVNLTGAPFSASSSNMFVAMSCGVRASLNSISGNHFSSVGCTSTCSHGNNRTRTNILCYGIDCCETSIPSILDSYTISFDYNNTGVRESGGCKYGFVVSQDYWNDYKNRSTNVTETSDMDYVPLILDWYLTNHTYFDVFNASKPKRDKPNSPECSNYYYGSSSNSPVTYLSECQCKNGLLGNPYIIDGCTQDVNECESKWPPCSSGSTCVNTFGSYHCSYRNRFLIIGFGSAFGALFLLFSTWRLYKGIKKRKDTNLKKKFFKQNGGLLLQQQMSSGEGSVDKTKLFNSNELQKATDNFSSDRILGQGGQGTVYKGMMEDGKIVAVKKSKIVDESRLSEFINEVVILSQINHRNVVQLLGCCLETEVPILVYEFIPNGTLSDYIHVRNEEFPFSWKMRVRIAAEIAGALAYLHSAAAFPIYHRDIKSTNILLDEKYKAKVADFGTSRTIALEQTHLTTLVYGTFGYLDPEYFQSSQFTDKSDVYSFGVVLVELLTGQKAICTKRADETRNLATYFIMSMEANALFDILDAQIHEDGLKEEITLIASLALTCLSLSGRHRPTMKEVATELEAMLKPERSEAHSNVQKKYEEIKFVRADIIEPWDDTSVSTGPVFNSTTQSSLLQELPLLSLE